MSTSAEIMKIKFPDKMPVWIEKSSKCALPDIPKNKYLVPKGYYIFSINVCCS